MLDIRPRSAPPRPSANKLARRVGQKAIRNNNNGQMLYPISAN